MAQAIKEFYSANIILDILIDEESYDVVRQCFPLDFSADGVGFPLSDLKEFLNNRSEVNWADHTRALLKSLSAKVTHLALSRRENGNLSIRSDSLTTNGWPYSLIMVAKLVRAKLMEIGTTESLRALDLVASFLLGQVSQLAPHSSKKYPASELLLYLEAAACHSGDISIGCADKALSILKTSLKQNLENLPEAKKSPYELVALFNKAVCLAHKGDTFYKSESIRLFDMVIDAVDGEWYSYHEEASSLTFNAAVLWKRYVYFPACLAKAEVLLDLNRSQNSKEVSHLAEGLMAKQEKIRIPFSCGVYLDWDYKIMKCKLNKYFAVLDRGDIQADYHEKARQLVSALRENGKWPSLLNYAITFEIELNQHKQVLRQQKGEKLDDTIWEALNTQGARFEQTELKSDKADFLLSWLQIFETIAESIKQEISFLSSEERAGALEFFFKMPEHLEDCEDVGWVPRRAEILKHAFNIIDLLFRVEVDLNKQELVEVEFRLAVRILNKDKKYLPRWEKVQRIRRLEYFLRELPLREGSKKLRDEVRSLVYSDEYAGIHLPNSRSLESFSRFLNRTPRHRCLKIMRRNIERFDGRLLYATQRQGFPDAYGLTVLRKWQSFTPSLSGGPFHSLGGGYFVYKTNPAGEVVEGLVIDPGYDFAENFFGNGFCAYDISGVILTHYHPDHVNDFRAILNIFNEVNSRGPTRVGKAWEMKKLVVIGTVGTLEPFFEDIKRSKELFKDTIVVSPDTDDWVAEAFKYFDVKPIPAYHKDLGRSDGMGVIIKASNASRPLVGFSGDTVWVPSLGQHYKDCPVICVNLGGLLDVRKDHSFDITFGDPNKICDFMLSQKHLYLPGFILLMDYLLQQGRTKLVIISEICEELKGGIRKDLATWVEEHFRRRRPMNLKGDLKVLVEDVGLSVELGRPKWRVRCSKCGRMVQVKEIEMISRHEAHDNEQLYYYCPECHERYLRLTRSEQHDF